jgi:hypothetical protein
MTRATNMTKTQLQGTRVPICKAPPLTSMQVRNMGLERGRLSAEKLMKLMKAMLLVKHVRNDKVAVQVCPGVWLGSIGAAYNKEFIQVRARYDPRPLALFDRNKVPWLRGAASPEFSALAPVFRSRTRTS